MINKGAVAVDVQTHLRSSLSKIESIRTIRNHPSIYATLIISVLTVTVRNQIRASDVYRMIILYQTVWNRTHWIKKFAGTRKILKLIQKLIRRCKILQIEEIHRRYTRLWNICFQMQKSLEGVWRQLANDQLDFRLRCDLSHNTRYFGFYTGIIGGNRWIYWSCRWAFHHSEKTEGVQIKCMEVMANPSFLCYIAYYLHHTCAIGYFSLLR